MGKNKVDLAELLFEQYPKINERKPVLDRISPTRILSCPRGAFFTAFGFRESLNPQSEQNFAFGNLAHEKIQTFLSEKGIAFDTEREITYDDPPLLGFVDAIATIDGRDHVVEIKTTSKKLSQIPEPMPSHLNQIMMYMHITDIYKGIILYESKSSNQDTNPWKSFDIEYDKSHAEIILRRGKKLMKNIEEFKIPMPLKSCRCKNPACWDKSKQKEAKVTWGEYFEN